jgi:hypothetical protein
MFAPNTYPATRAAAKALGATRYFTGAPCCNGHIETRCTSNWACSECTRNNKSAWREAHPDKWRAQKQRSRQRKATK